MPAIGNIAPRDKARPFAVKFKDEETGAVELVQVEYYKNRMSLAPMEALISDDVADDLSDDQLEAARIASNLCNSLKSWDLTGELRDYKGNVIVADGEVIPLDPMVVMYVPSAITGEIIRQIVEAIFPNQSKSRNERRRSR